MPLANSKEPHGEVREEGMRDRERDGAHDRQIAPPDVDPTPAAQPPSPQPSITGAETGITPQTSLVSMGSCSASIGWPSRCPRPPWKTSNNEWAVNGWKWRRDSTAILVPGSVSAREAEVAAWGRGCPTEHARCTSRSPVRLSRLGSRRRCKPSVVGSMSSRGMGPAWMSPWMIEPGMPRSAM